MDIKDFILVCGGLLIVMVLGHGFWIAWRAKNASLAMDIVPLVGAEGDDEPWALSGELPNGGARLARASSDDGAQAELPLELSDAAKQPQASSDQANTPEPSSTQSVRAKAPFDRPKKITARTSLAVKAGQSTGGGRVRRVASHTPVASLSGLTNARKEQHATEKSSFDESQDRLGDDDNVLLIINVLAKRGQRFDGERLVDALRSQGLRYGDKNIFHRVDAVTKAQRYSIANAVEPGTFDLADLAAMRSPGIAFFLQLADSDDALAIFEDMLNAAHQIANTLGGEIRDKDMSLLSGQSVEHMRQSIADFSRRRLAKRA